MVSLLSSAAAMRPEVELLLWSVRVGDSAEEARKAQALLQANIDWAYLSRAAYDHAVLPLLYQHLRTTCPEAVPEEALNKLRDEFINNTSSSLALTGVLLKLLDLSEAHDIHAIPYKGPALAASAYGDVALRQYADLDLIVRKRDVLKLKALLVARGWRTEFELTAAQEAAFLDRSYDYEFRKDGMLIEIHWELTERFFNFPLDVERLWERIVPVTIAGRQVMTLSPEDSLLIVCVHASKHLWARLGWVCDVAKLIETQREMNWKVLMAHAAKLGSKRMLYLGLLLASDLLGASLPDEISQEVHSDSAVKALAANAVKRLFDDETNWPSMLAVSMLHLKMRESLRDRAIYCLRFALAITVGDLTSVKMPQAIFFLYYPLRPLRLAGKYGRRLLNRVFSGAGKQDT